MKYWRSNPPVHVALFVLGQFFGAWDAPAGKARLATEAEMRAALEPFRRAGAGLH